MDVSVSVDINNALQKIASIRAEVLDKAIPRALNRVADMAKTQASKEIRDQSYNLRAADIKRAIRIGKATKAMMVSIVGASGNPLPLILYDAKQVKNGVSVKVKAGRKLIRGAFIATMASGHTGVFDRNGGKGHKKVISKGGKVQWRGLPIFELFGPSIPSAFINKSVQSALVATIREKFPERLQHEIGFLSLK